MKKVVVIVNIGTPSDCSLKAVRKFLREFLSDPRVIDIPGILRMILVNFIIVPFRSRKSLKMYRAIWTERGSPVDVHLRDLTSGLQGMMNDDDVMVFGVMRYGEPSLKTALRKMRSVTPDEIVLCPLYPQYASSTTGSAIEMLMDEAGKWKVIPGLKIISSFHNHLSFIAAFAAGIRNCQPHLYDHVLFSYHGVPLSHLKNSLDKSACIDCQGGSDRPCSQTRCYKADCYETTRLIAKEMDFTSDFYSTGFQSRLSRNWTSPFTDEIIVDLAKAGIKRLLVAAPSFVADCLETLYEIEIEYKQLFIKNGGTELRLVQGLNSSDAWIRALNQILR